VIEYVDYQRALRQAGADTDPMLRQQQRRQTQACYRSAVDARVQSALTTPAPFVISGARQCDRPTRRPE